MTPSAPIDERCGITSQARNQSLAPFGVLFCPRLGYYCADGEAQKTAVFLGLDFQREFESSSLQRGVRSEPLSGRSHLGPGQAVDLRDDHDVDRAGLGQALLEAGCPTMQRSAVWRLELADGAPTRDYRCHSRRSAGINRPVIDQTLPVVVSGCLPYGRDGVPWYGVAKFIGIGLA
jgi:hypothetical protein